MGWNYLWKHMTSPCRKSTVSLIIKEKLNRFSKEYNLRAFVIFEFVHAHFWSFFLDSKVLRCTPLHCSLKNFVFEYLTFPSVQPTIRKVSLRFLKKKKKTVKSSLRIWQRFPGSTSRHRREKRAPTRGKVFLVDADARRQLSGNHELLRYPTARS